jgi:hypothetical protein
MSNDETSVLGKRAQHGKDGEPIVASGSGDGQFEDDEDDIGPMPMSGIAGNSVRKKRKGILSPPSSNPSYNFTSSAS